MISFLRPVDLAELVQKEFRDPKDQKDGDNDWYLISLYCNGQAYGDIEFE
ncbi:MAG: hypothetical protein R3C28_19820 [Pirellulaceae bacterium]